MILKNRYCCALVGLVALTTSAVLADDQALIDALVRKGILTQKDAEKIEAEVSKNPVAVAQPSSPLKLAPWIKELKLSGDLRLRYQFDEEQRQEPSGPNATGTNHVAQRSRWRFRLRLNAEMKFDNGFFGGFSLTTNNAADSGNQTFTGGFQNYSIFISKAFLGWNGYPGLAIIAGKQDNPFYTTDMFWDPDIYPQGLVERIDFDKLFGWNSAGEPVSYSKEDKAPPPAPAKHPSAFELSLIAGQFIFYDNAESQFDSDLHTDSYLFEEQLLARYKTDVFSITFGPSLFTANAGAYGHDSSLPPAKADPLVFTNGVGEERDLFVVLAPGDITVKAAGIPIKFYWDFAYNFNGGKRYDSILAQPAQTGQRLPPPVPPPAGVGLFGGVRLNAAGNVVAFTNPAQVSDRDKTAWLIGLKVGDNKKAGDLAAYVDYRQVGIAATDPNLDNDDMMNGRLNFQGFSFGVSYSITDFFILGVSSVIDWNLKNLYGGQATRGSGIADDNSWHYIRVDALLKF
jgi:putative porin